MQGELAALSAAVCWAVATIYYAEVGKCVKSANLNMIKGLVAIVLMILVLACGSAFDIHNLSFFSLFSATSTQLLLLIISGIIGIGIGDTAYFACIRRIGPQKGLMLESTAPLFATIIGIGFFSEFLPLTSWLGVLLIVLGVILVVKRTRGATMYFNSPTGILLGVFAAMGQATGIVFSRMALADGSIDPLASSFLRLLAGLVFLFGFATMRRWGRSPSRDDQSLVQAFAEIYKKNVITILLVAVLVGTFLTLWLQQIAVFHTKAGIAQALLSTCPLFGMLISVYKGYRQPLFVWCGLLISIGGVSMLFVF